MLTMWPPPPASKPHFVVVLDLLGYRQILHEKGLHDLYVLVHFLLHAIEESTRLEGLMLTHENTVEHYDVKISHLFASDTIMLWTDDKNVPYLIGASALLMNKALQFSLPLRGSLAYGDCIFHSERNIHIGHPIVEAIEKEKEQEWIGIGVLRSAAEQLKGHPAIVEYDVPMKEGKAPLKHALAWHHWEEVPEGATIYLNRLMDSAGKDHCPKYKNTFKFMESFPLSQA